MNYQSIFKRRRVKQKEKAIKLYPELKKKKLPMGEIWATLEEAVGLSRQTIKRDLKEVGLYGNDKG